MKGHNKIVHKIVQKHYLTLSSRTFNKRSKRNNIKDHNYELKKYSIETLHEIDYSYTMKVLKLRVF